MRPFARGPVGPFVFGVWCLVLFCDLLFEICDFFPRLLAFSFQLSAFLHPASSIQYQGSSIQKQKTHRDSDNESPWVLSI